MKIVRARRIVYVRSPEVLEPRPVGTIKVIDSKRAVRADDGAEGLVRPNNAGTNWI
jgi:hypothetical protein